MLRKGTAAEAAKSLNSIARINNKPPVVKGEVQQLMDEEEKYQTMKENISPLDLFRHRSIHTPSIVFWNLL